MTTNNSINSNIPIEPSKGGTGVNNGSYTITISGSFTTVGAFGTTFTTTGVTAVTLPTSGTLATAEGTVASITGTANQIDVSNPTGNVILSLPNNVFFGKAAGGNPGTVSIFPTTASKGKLLMQAADNSGDTTTTIQVAAQAGTRTYTIPDAGADASFVQTQGAQTLDGVKTFSSIPVFSAGFNVVSGYQELFYQDTTISAGSLAAMNTTPQTIVSAPGAGFAVIPLQIIWNTAGGTAYTNVVQSMNVRYTNSSGAVCATPTTCSGFFNQTSEQLRYAGALGSDSGTNSSFAPVDNAVVVAHLGTSDLTTGNFGMKVRVFYKIIPTSL